MGKGAACGIAEHPLTLHFLIVQPATYNRPFRPVSFESFIHLFPQAYAWESIGWSWFVAAGTRVWRGCATPPIGQIQPLATLIHPTITTLHMTDLKKKQKKQIREIPLGCAPRPCELCTV